MTLAAQQIIQRLKQSRKVTDVRHTEDSKGKSIIHYTRSGKKYRIEHEINFRDYKVELHLFGPAGILHVCDKAEDMCDFILI